MREGSWRALSKVYVPTVTFDNFVFLWQQTNYTGKGSIWANSDSFLKNDTISSGQRKYISKLVFNKTDYLVDYDDKKLFAATKDMFLDQTFLTARYLPINIINYFYQQKIGIDNEIRFTEN